VVDSALLDFAGVLLKLRAEVFVFVFSTSSVFFWFVSDFVAFAAGVISSDFVVVNFSASNLAT
jgi:hypothetical protein